MSINRENLEYIREQYLLDPKQYGVILNKQKSKQLCEEHQTIKLLSEMNESAFHGYLSEHAFKLATKLSDSLINCCDEVPRVDETETFKYIADMTLDCVNNKYVVEIKTDPSDERFAYQLYKMKILFPDRIRVIVTNFKPNKIEMYCDDMGFDDVRIVTYAGESL
jgi:hypothetical protein